MQGLIKPEHKSCPLWVKLHNIPLVAFNREGVACIASALGVLKMMDDHTTSMCDSTWGRPGFAKVLIDVWAVGELKRELQVFVSDIEGGKEVEVPIKVEYIWEPSQCSHCLVFGHKVGSCVKAVVSKTTDKGKAPKANQVDDGFTVVTNMKKAKKTNEASIPIGDKRPKFVYKPINKAHVSVFGVKEDAQNGGAVDNTGLGKEGQMPKVMEGKNVHEEVSLCPDGVSHRVNVKNNTVHEGTPIVKKIPLLTSVVKSFKGVSKAKRGPLITSMSNRFELLDGDLNDVITEEEEGTDSFIPDSLDAREDVPKVPGEKGVYISQSSC